MKHNQKGSAGIIVLVVILLVAIGIYLYETRKANTVVVPVGTITQPTTPISNGWKTYTNSVYGFSFEYPATWKLVEDNNKKEVTLTSDSVTSGANSMPLEVLSFAATTKNFFNPPLGTKYGEIAYDSNRMTLVDSSSSPVRCLSAAPIFNTAGAIEGITYAGSMMSDPAYSNSAILLKNGGIVLADEDWEVDDTDQAKNTTAKADVAKIASSFTLLNGNTVSVAACAQ
jgi:hypothetical protein